MSPRCHPEERSDEGSREYARPLDEILHCARYARSVQDDTTVDVRTLFMNEARVTPVSS